MPGAIITGNPLDRWRRRAQRVARRGTAHLFGLLLDLAIARRRMSSRAPSSPDRAVHAPHATDYQVLKRIMTTHPVASNDVFVDIGAGYGRVCAYVRRHCPEARVVGIEIDPLVHDHATKIHRRNPSIKWILGSAPEAIPHDATYLYMYNPFPPPVLASVLKSLAQWLPLQATVVLANPASLEPLRAEPWLIESWNVRDFSVNTLLLPNGTISYSVLKPKRDTVATAQRVTLPDDVQ